MWAPESTGSPGLLSLSGYDLILPDDTICELSLLVVNSVLAAEAGWQRPSKALFRALVVILLLRVIISSDCTTHFLFLTHLHRVLRRTGG
jgi:hypothetical protein